MPLKWQGLKRDDYLSQIWKPYPEMPADVLVAGRLYDIESLDRNDAGIRLKLFRNNQIIKIEMDHRPQNLDFLVPGDLIAITQGQELVLLAPQKAKLPKRQFTPQLIRSWNTFLREIREFFFQRDFLEVKTPSLVPCPGTEPSLDVFSSELVLGSKRQKLYLPTSPELHLKKALALGADKIFELSPCFRNGEITERHQPEFLMLEWYRAFASLHEIKQDLVQLVNELCAKLEMPPPSKVLYFSVAELFRLHCDFDLRPETSKEQLHQLATRCGVDCRSAESIDDYFFLIFMDKIETQLPLDALVFVEKYPPYQAALARLTAEGWGDRFEVYWKGLELANAFNELNDPQVQRARTLEDLEKKRTSGKEVVGIDEEFFQCLEAGMPPSGGVALGVERLFMAIMDEKKISDLNVFPY